MSTLLALIEAGAGCATSRSLCRPRPPHVFRDWIARKGFYGGSAAPLSVRHPDKTAPVVISGWAMALGPDVARTGISRLGPW